MQFTIVARDGTDEQALERRMAVREQHIANTEELIRQGSALYAVALLDESDAMCGSVMVVDFPSREDVDAWLAREPYVTGGVWQDIQVLPCRVGPSFAATNRS